MNVLTITDTPIRSVAFVNSLSTICERLESCYWKMQVQANCLDRFFSPLKPPFKKLHFTSWLPDLSELHHGMVVAVKQLQKYPEIKTRIYLNHSANKASWNMYLIWQFTWLNWVMAWKPWVVPRPNWWWPGT